MKLHSLSLIWGVTSEAMEYEERAEKRERKREQESVTDRLLRQGEPNSGQQSFRPVSVPSSPQRKHRPVLSSIPSGDAMGGANVVEETTQSTVAGSSLNDPGPSLHTQGKDANAGGRTQSPTAGQQSASTASPATTPPVNRARSRLRRLAFVGLGGTIGGILGSVLASAAARTLHLSGLLVVAALLLELSAELSIELGKIMLRHWEEEQCNLLAEMTAQQQQQQQQQKQQRGIGEVGGANDEVDSSMKRVRSLGSMKRVASGGSLTVAAMGGAEGSKIRKTQSAVMLSALNSRNTSAGNRQLPQRSSAGMQQATNTGEKTRNAAATATTLANATTSDDNSFKQRLLRGVTTILRSRLLMCIFTYNALAATTTVLLSFQRAKLVANRSPDEADQSSTEKDTAFLAKINMASSMAVFALQASGLGALVANFCGQYGTLALMPLARLCGVLALAWWHVKGSGKPPNLTLFLILDEFAKVVNFAVAKPVRESLWRGLSNEARYEAKPIVDTLANRWGGGSAAFLTSFIGVTMDYTGLGGVAKDGTKTLLGFPPILILCTIAAVWWAVVSLDLGNIRRRIDLELKKQQ
mmetsp:Transcript_36941/g.75345  ORF Transcript_36941/g.75345 Transcript_36941/m.75345 type:complete len:583 (-) Transcript_36941:183-1931(-)